MVVSHVVRDLHRNRSWTCWWLKRYTQEGIEGLKDRPKTGRPSKVSKQIEYRIKKVLKESNQGWITKQVEGLIIEKSEIKYHCTIHTAYFVDRF